MGDVSSGTVSLGSATAVGNYSNVVSMGSWSGSQEVSLNLQGTSAWEKISLEITLHRGTPTTGPRLEGYQLRAQPAPKARRELIQVPLMLFDRERNRWGTELGGDGYAYARFIALKALEGAGLPVVYQDFRTQEAQLVYI